MISTHPLSSLPSYDSAVQLRHEVEGVTARLRFISEAHQTVKDDIALTRRATEKTTTDVARAEEDKLNQVNVQLSACTPHVNHKMVWIQVPLPENNCLQICVVLCCVPLSFWHLYVNVRYIHTSWLVNSKYMYMYQALV